MKRVVLLMVLLYASGALAQESSTAGPQPVPEARMQEIQQLRAELARLSARLDALEKTPAPAGDITAVQPVGTAAPGSAPAASAPVTAIAVSAPASAQPVALPKDDQQTSSLSRVLPSALPGGATLNYTFDGYYEYNFNQPPGRVNNLRAYDVLSNVFSVNQAALVFALEPDLEKGRRYGLRLDLQFGQATDTLQGNPQNEPRPEIYRNIFQAYGTYVLPVGKGLTLDVGKWSSSLGLEGNYTKDQMNYTRSFYFYYLPFYHAGVRASYPVNDKLTLNYWVVNGANQSEPTNGFKDEMFGFGLSPTKSITWTSNYYLGQEHADFMQATNCTGPVQPELCVAPINPAPNGKLHIFDNYVKWQVNPKLTLLGEGDYVIERLWANAGPGQSSAPSHVSGGALYAQYQLTPKTAFAARGEYLSDRGGLFSGSTQALKEVTGTYKYKFAEGFDAFLEFRHDWTNIPFFITHDVGSPSNHQTTATMGLVWWYGGKQGSW